MRLIGPALSVRRFSVKTPTCTPPPLPPLSLSLCLSVSRTRFLAVWCGVVPAGSAIVSDGHRGNVGEPGQLLHLAPRALGELRHRGSRRKSSHNRSRQAFGKGPRGRGAGERERGAGEGARWYAHTLGVFFFCFFPAGAMAALAVVRVLLEGEKKEKIWKGEKRNVAQEIISACFFAPLGMIHPRPHTYGFILFFVVSHHLSFSTRALVWPSSW